MSGDYQSPNYINTMSLFNRIYNTGHHSRYYAQGTYTSSIDSLSPAPMRPKIEEKPRQRAKGPSFKCPTDLITIEIGPNKTKFVVHKEFACYYSPVLKAALNSDVFIEGQTQTYTLEEADENTGRLLVHWLYPQNLDILEHEDWTLNETDDETLAMAQLWVLADKLLIPRLQNQVLRKIKYPPKDDYALPIGALSYVYDHTPKGSPLRRFMVHLCACYLKPEVYAEQSDDFPKEMLIELAQAYAENLYAGDVERAFGMEADWSQYDVEENVPSSRNNE